MKIDALDLNTEHFTDAEAFVHSHVKPAYDQGCIFMYQDV